MTNQDEPRQDRCLSIPQFASFLGLSIRSVYRMIERGQVEVVKIGKCTRITPEGQRRCISTLPKAEYHNHRLVESQHQ